MNPGSLGPGVPLARHLSTLTTEYSHFKPTSILAFFVFPAKAGIQNLAEGATVGAGLGPARPAVMR
jgi:hypothetical protein